ncbi:MAG: PIN domain nuclease [Gaiellaceae bacterium]
MVELADTSAWFVSRRDQDVRAAFDALVRRAEVATCDAVKLELLYTARNAVELSARRAELDLLPQCSIGPREVLRALDVYERLAQQGGLHHRRVKHPDLLIAAAAESAGVPVLHYDGDFDTIAGVTGQPMRWIAPSGSI